MLRRNILPVLRVVRNRRITKELLRFALVLTLSIASIYLDAQTTSNGHLGLSAKRVVMPGADFMRQRILELVTLP